MNSIWQSDHFYFQPVEEVEYDSRLTATEFNQLLRSLQQKLGDLPRLMKEEMPFLKTSHWVCRLKKSELFEQDCSLLVQKIEKSAKKNLIMVDISSPVTHDGEDSQGDAETSFALHFYKTPLYHVTDGAVKKKPDISGRKSLGCLELTVS